MNPLPRASYIELRVPTAESEQQFLLLAVQAAVKKYREQHGHASLPQATIVEEYFIPQGGH